MSAENAFALLARTGLSHDADALRALELPAGVPRLPALDGEPAEAFVDLFVDATTEIGVWECTPGRFAAAKEGIGELMWILGGSGTLTAADGTAHEFGPGTMLLTPDGWRGEWEVRETVRKLYVIWKTAPAA